MKQIEEPARRIPVRAEVDVLVVGAGPAGLMAAQAAALEKGTKVMLVESRGFLGGNMTIGLPLLGFLGSIPSEAWYTLFAIMGTLHIIAAVVLWKMVRPESPETK